MSHGEESLYLTKTVKPLKRLTGLDVRVSVASARVTERCSGPQVLHGRKIAVETEDRFDLDCPADLERLAHKIRMLISLPGFVDNEQRYRAIAPLADALAKYHIDKTTEWRSIRDGVVLLGAYFALGTLGAAGVVIFLYWMAVAVLREIGVF